VRTTQKTGTEGQPQTLRANISLSIPAGDDVKRNAGATVLKYRNVDVNL
jgi:hypothetical protein